MKEKIGWTYGKHALILGAGGIGSEIGRNLVRKCRKLTFVDYDNKKLEELKSKLQKVSESQTNIDICTMDMSDFKKMKELINKIYEKEKDQIDIFINCAADCDVIKLFEEMSYSDIATMFNANARTPIFWLRELIPYMKNNSIKTGDLKRGHILTMSSRSAERALVKQSLYASTKAAVDKLIEGVRKECSKYKLVFTLISPGSINTPFTSKWSRKNRDEHNFEAMSVEEGVLPILQALDTQVSINRISYESITQWAREPGALK